METIIRKPIIQELDQLLGLWKEQYDFHHKLDPFYYVEYSAENEAVFKSYLEKGIWEDTPRILIAEVEAKLVGFITCTKVTNDYFDANIKEFGEVKELFVQEQYRGMGIGRKLIAEVEKICKAEGLNFIQVGVSSYNIEGLEFYEDNQYLKRQCTLIKQLQ